MEDADASFAGRANVFENFECSETGGKILLGGATQLNGSDDRPWDEQDVSFMG